MAEYKPFQLSLARTSGLLIPETLITNDPDQIRQAFHKFGGRMIVKPVRTGFVDYGEEQHAVYTSRVLKQHLGDVESARICPSIYQPLLEKACDIRVTVVGDRLFVAEIDSQSDPDAAVDWRRTSNPDLPHRRGMLSASVAVGILRLTRLLGLTFAAIDLVRTPSGEYVFLEVNPNGQWLWLDDTLNLGITQAVADWLAAPPETTG
jgi:glutathione synthase/RimK-type ligase-like ATP-grasp enzyme